MISGASSKEATEIQGGAGAARSDGGSNSSGKADPGDAVLEKADEKQSLAAPMTAAAEIIARSRSKTDG